MLERADLTAVEAVRRLVGLQAQDSPGPYLGLAARLHDFDRAELTVAIEARDVYVATLQRVTMHLVTAADHSWLKPTLMPLLEKTRRRPGIAGLDQERILAEVRQLAPARMPELKKLAPDAPQGYFNDFVQANLPLVRVPPAGTWRVGGSATQELVETGSPDPKQLVRRYLEAFGPATVKDAQTWSGLTGLAKVFSKLDLDDLGDGYFDVPGAPRPPADTKAPPRFLPRFDNVLIAYADRSRFGTPEIGRATILVDGTAAGTWEWRDGDVHVTPYDRLPSEVEQERRRLREWLRDG